MKMFIRRFILLLLLVLQGFSPLVHAHVQADGSNMGLHFHGTDARLSQHVEVAALDISGHCDAVIDIKLAIMQKKFLDCELSNDSFTFANVYFLPAIVITKYKASSSYITPIKAAIYLTTAIPRGPPH